MKKKISPAIAALVVVVAVGICGYIYSTLPIGPNINPMMPKGSNKPPPGTRAHKNDIVTSKDTNMPDGGVARPKKEAPAGKPSAGTEKAKGSPAGATGSTGDKPKDAGADKKTD